MRRHFPDGYEIVRAEEVVEGQRVLDLSRIAQIETDPTINALDQKINLGKVAETSSAQQKDSLPILESRIIYKRKSYEGPSGANGFAAVSSLAPSLYLDPNEMARGRNKLELANLKTPKPTETADKGKDTDSKPAASVATKDPETKRASAESTAAPSASQAAGTSSQTP